MRESGSSPRERGTRLGVAADQRRVRFIPARAGNTRASASTSSLSTVHPRASGEHTITLRVQIATHGSSPRERGTPRTAQNAQRRQRFIPARAGNTSAWALMSSARTVHPRASGEHTPATATLNLIDGSSPRERGTRARMPGSPAGRRFIPARAGNTKAGVADALYTAVHPRASGEHTSAISMKLHGKNGTPDSTEASRCL